MRTNFKDWCARSDASTDEVLRVVDAIGKGAWCAGGAVRRTLIGKALDSDFDFFFRSQEALEVWEKRLPATLAMVNETEHHKHWRGPVAGSDLPIDVQAIKFRFYQSAEEVIDSFDYTITMFAIEVDDILGDYTLVTTPEALWDLGRRKLAIHKVTYPVATMRRMYKYMQQGFTACQGCMATLLRETASHPEALARMDIQYVD